MHKQEKEDHGRQCLSNTSQQRCSESDTACQLEYSTRVKKHTCGGVCPRNSFKGLESESGCSGGRSNTIRFNTCKGAKVRSPVNQGLIWTTAPWKSTDTVFHIVLSLIWYSIRCNSQKSQANDHLVITSSLHIKMSLISQSPDVIYTVQTLQISEQRPKQETAE